MDSRLSFFLGMIAAWAAIVLLYYGFFLPQYIFSLVPILTYIQIFIWLLVPALILTALVQLIPFLRTRANTHPFVAGLVVGIIVVIVMIPLLLGSSSNSQVIN
jgi:hypothetical protein